jgi:DNA-cytosine methyltransferase
MRYGSVCSGIEAATVAWHPLGWKASFFSEIDKFPRAILSQRWPEVPLHGDFTTIEANTYGPIRLLVGGTPCQSFSIAGLRGGMDDHRGNLALEFCKLADRLKPDWIVWENVPGVISSNEGKDLTSILDGIESLGYVVDIEILDAQYHSVPQRRRRVFICGQSVNSLLTQTSDSSALTIAQCWQEILHGILVLVCKQSGIALENSDSASLLEDGVRRRIKLFGLDGSGENFNLSQSNLIEALRRRRREQNISDVPHGESEKEPTPEDRLTASQMDDPFTPTEQSLSSALAASYEVMKSFITLTRINSITKAQIYTCSEAALLIARLIQLLNPSSPPFWSAASSALMGLRAFTNYARQTSSDLFGDVERLHAWCDFIEQAEPTIEALGDIRVESFGDVFPVADCLQRNHPPSRSPRKETSGGVREGIAGSLGAHKTGGWGGTDLDNHGAYIPEQYSCDIADTLSVGANQTTGFIGDVVASVTSKWAKGTGGPAGDECQNLVARPLPAQSQSSHREDSDNFVAYRTAGNCGPYEEGDNIALLTTNTDPCSHLIAFSSQDSSDISPMNHSGSHANGGGQVAIAIRTAQTSSNGCGIGTDEQAYMLDSTNGQAVASFSAGQTEGAGPIAYREEQSPTLRGGASGTNQVPALLRKSQVRRLTPRECERLQGFPDDYTLIEYRGKRTKDGPRYKVIGNSMAVPVMRWIGERIQMVDNLINQQLCHTK